jgi:hypothetical protein
MVDYQNMNYYQQLNFIFGNIQLVIAIIGIVGGILNICVFSRKALKSFSFSFYMKAMSCCDIIGEIHAIRHWFAFVFGLNLDTVSIYFCKFDEYQAFVATCVALWLINVISLDRLAIVVYSNNQKFQVFKKKWFKVAILLLLIVCSLSLNILHPLKNEIVFLPDSAIQICIMPPDSGAILSYTILGNTIVSIIIINAVLNTKIIVYVMQTRKKISANMRSSSTAVKDRRFVINALVLNSSCFICKTAFMICTLVITYGSINGDLAQLIFTIGVSISIIDNALTFFINLIVNPTFYVEFLCMIGLRKQQAISSVKTDPKNKANSNNSSITGNKNFFNNTSL